jgi:hypothetical protein
MLDFDLPTAFRGQYQPIRRLGQGNFGTCWVVVDQAKGIPEEDIEYVLNVTWALGRLAYF